MANTNVLNSRLVLRNDVKDKREESSLVLLKGEAFIEYTSIVVKNDEGEDVEQIQERIYFGDGVTALKDLKPATMTPEEIKKIIDSASGVLSVENVEPEVEIPAHYEIVTHHMSQEEMDEYGYAVDSWEKFTKTSFTQEEVDAIKAGDKPIVGYYMNITTGEELSELYIAWNGHNFYTQPTDDSDSPTSYELKLVDPVYAKSGYANLVSTSADGETEQKIAFKSEGDIIIKGSGTAEDEDWTITVDSSEIDKKIEKIEETIGDFEGSLSDKFEEEVDTITAALNEVEEEVEDLKEGSKVTIKRDTEDDEVSATYTFYQGVEDGLVDEIVQYVDADGDTITPEAYALLPEEDQANYSPVTEKVPGKVPVEIGKVKIPLDMVVSDADIKIFTEEELEAGVLDDGETAIPESVTEAGVAYLLLYIANSKGTVLAIDLRQLENTYHVAAINDEDSDDYAGEVKVDISDDFEISVEVDKLETKKLIDSLDGTILVLNGGNADDINVDPADPEDSEFGGFTVAQLKGMTKEEIAELDADTQKAIGYDLVTKYGTITEEDKDKISEGTYTGITYMLDVDSYIPEDIADGYLAMDIKATIDAIV